MDRRRIRHRAAAAVAVGVALATALSGCALFGGTAKAAPKPSHTRTHTPSATPSRAPTPTPTVAPTPPPPPPTLTPVPAGTVVAEGDVASPKGSIHYHYRVVADGDNSFTAQYSGFTSTVPVPVSVTLLEIPPQVGDGLTYHGVGDHVLGGPTTAAQSSTASIDVGQPRYLGTLVTYSSVASADGVPVELGPDKVLAVNTVRWSVPVRESNVHPVDGGVQTAAAGTVVATTATGAPKKYEVAPGDTVGAVATRFGISVQDLLWLNDDLGAIGDSVTLYTGTPLNLDPDSL